MADFKQANRLTIATVLGKPSNDYSDTDALLLAAVDGVEGVSQPYGYDLTLLRPTTYPHIEPNALINSPATIGIKFALDHFQEVPIVGVKIQEHEDAFVYVKRYGVFSWFENLGQGRIGHLGGASFIMYRARIISNFQMMANEIVYRVFEKMNVVDIINLIMNAFPSVYCDMKSLTDAEKDPDRFPTMEICFQYGESTFNFLSRLMAQFGIWYYFDHDPQVGKEKLVLRAGPAEFDPCKVRDASFEADLAKLHIRLDQQVLTQHEPSPISIANFQAHYLSAPNVVRTRNFKPLVPTDLPKGEAKIQDYYDLLQNDSGSGGGSNGKDPRFQINVFPGPFVDKPKADADAVRRIAAEESQVYVFGGRSKNPAFMAGQKFQVVPRPTASQDPGTSNIEFDAFPFRQPGGQSDGSSSGPRSFNITFVHFNSYENSFGHSVAKDFAGFLKTFFSPITNIFSALFGGGGKPILDLTLAATAGGLNNYIKTVRQNANQNALYNSMPKTKSGAVANPEFANVKATSDLRFSDYFDAGAIASVTTLITSFGGSTSTAIDEIVINHKDDYGNNFAALADGIPMPLPSGMKPLAAGPHLAVVIGQDGTKDAAKGGKTDIWHDPLGRVRVRFPWDPGPPKQGQSSSVATQPTWESAEADDPLASDRNTCWVWVSEGWAGRGFGTQFLPRIGQEVLVDFIDGDPDRPIVTGRIYNADNPQNFPNLPFPDPATAQTAVTSDDLLKVNGSPNFRFTGIKTQSTPQPQSGTNDRFHLLRFDDTWKKEQYLIRSQHRLDITAFQTRYESIHHDRHLTVGGKKTDPKEIGGDYLTKIFRHYYLHVGDPDFPTQSGNRITLLEQDEQLKIVKDSLLSIGGNWNTVVGGNYYLHVGGGSNGGGKRTTIIDQTDEIQVAQDSNHTLNGNWSTKVAKQATIDANMTIVLNANTNISLVVGSSTIVITPSAIAITAPMVMINSSGPPAASPMDPPPVTTNDPAPAAPTEPTAADPGDKLTPPE